jgi:Polyketide cyclase / dehydrase and lipid transport
MTTIYKEFILPLPAEQVWDALRDFGAVHQRVASGFVTACHVKSNGQAGVSSRVVTFANGRTVEERLISSDDARCRLVYSIAAPDGAGSHHQASVQVYSNGPEQSRFVWITDVLPHERGTALEAMMDLGMAAIQQTFTKSLDSKL